MAGKRKTAVMLQSSDNTEKGRRIMKQRTLFLALFIVFAVTVMASTAGAQDTSPYLAGTWLETANVTPTVRTTHFIVNPTTKQLDVYAVVFGYEGAGALLSCTRCTINGNGLWKFYGDAARTNESTNEDSGVVKFFAFPRNSRKFDPNAVIGGFQQNIFEDVNGRTGLTESNLKAVTINSNTIGEFSMIPLKCKTCEPD
jgi:hypothetical protein